MVSGKPRLERTTGGFGSAKHEDVGVTVHGPSFLELSIMINMKNGIGKLFVK